jgi:hypothetical protein
MQAAALLAACFMLVHYLAYSSNLKKATIYPSTRSTDFHVTTWHYIVSYRPVSTQRRRYAHATIEKGLQELFSMWSAPCPLLDNGSLNTFPQKCAVEQQDVHFYLNWSGGYVRKERICPLFITVLDMHSEVTNTSARRTNLQFVCNYRKISELGEECCQSSTVILNSLSYVERTSNLIHTVFDNWNLT